MNPIGSIDLCEMAQNQIRISPVSNVGPKLGIYDQHQLGRVSSRICLKKSITSDCFSNIKLNYFPYEWVEYAAPLLYGTLGYKRKCCLIG